MSIYNRLKAIISCPYCHCTELLTIDLYFGKRDLIDFKIGDQYAWIENKEPQNGGRPPGGNIDGEGYTVCKCCNRDFYVVVEVRKDTIMRVKYDDSKKGHLDQGALP